MTATTEQIAEAQDIADEKRMEVVVYRSRLDGNVYLVWSHAVQRIGPHEEVLAVVEPTTWRETRAREKAEEVRAWEEAEREALRAEAAAWDAQTADLRECAYCGMEITATGDRPPAVDDDREWERLARNHSRDCEWIATRGHPL